MSERPEALRLADCLDGNAKTPWTREEAATELRRMHAENASLKEQLDAIGAGGVAPLRKHQDHVEDDLNMLAADAARYRWLRSNDPNKVMSVNTNELVDKYFPIELDEAIDQAMKMNRQT